MWQNYIKGPYNATSPMKFTFLENDQQALAKVASGVQYDLIHPCIAYWPDYKQAGLIQAFDPSLLPDYQGIPAAIRDPGVGPDGLIYHVPFDIGFSTLTYRADKVNPAELSWNLLQDAEVQGPHVAVLRRGLDHQDRPPHQRRRAGRPEQADAGRDQRGRRHHEADRAEPAQLLGLADRHGQRLRQRQHRHHVHVAGRVLEDQDPPEDEGRPDRVPAAEGGPPGLGLRPRARRQHQGARPRDLRRRRRQHPEDGGLADRRLPVRLGAAERRCGAGPEQGDRRRLRARTTPPPSRRRRPGSRLRCRTAPRT